MRGYPRTFWYLWTGTLINRSGAFLMLFLEIYMVSYYHFTATFAGLVLGLFGAGLAAGSLVGGVLSDRWGRRGTLLLSNVAQAVTAVALGLTFAKLWIAVLAALYGVWNGLGRPAYTATMVDVLSPSLRLKGMNLNYWAINIGFSIAAVLAGILAHAAHLTVFLLNATVLISTGLMLFCLVPETKPAVRIGAPPMVSGSLRSVLTDRVFMVYVLLNAGLWTIIEACKLIPIAMHQRGLDPTDYGQVVAVNGIMIVLGQLFVPRLISGRKRAHVLAAAALMVGLGMGAVAVADSVPALMATVVVWTVGEMINAPVNGAYLADLSHPQQRGRYQGVASMSFTVSGFFAPVAGGMLLDHAAPATLWIALAGIGVLVAIGHLVTGPARDRRVRDVAQAQAQQRVAPLVTTS